jgi:hypothetical protein
MDANQERQLKRNRNRSDIRQLDPERMGWHRQPGESHQAYEAFTAYLMAGKKRTIQKAADAVGKERVTLAKWSRIWSWGIRAAQYEEHYMLAQLESIEAKREEMFHRHEIVATTALSIVEGSLELIAKAMSSDEESLVMKPDTLVRLFKEAVIVHRMSILGRVEAEADDAMRIERMAEEFADELSELMTTVMNEADLPDDKKVEIQRIVKRQLTKA